MTDDHQTIKLRLAPEIYEELKVAAVRARRTLSDEIVARLEPTLGQSAITPDNPASKSGGAALRDDENVEIVKLRSRLNILIKELRDAGVIKKATARNKND